MKRINLLKMLQEKRTITLSYVPKGDIIEVQGVLYKPIERGSRTLAELTIKEFNEITKDTEITKEIEG